MLGPWFGPHVEILVNPTGQFIDGGPSADCGVTGRKIIVDSYGGMGRHGGGAFSGKDPSKVDRSGAYFCRFVARQVVRNGLATRAEVQVAYAIGRAQPVSVRVDTFGTGDVAAAAEFVRTVRLSSRRDDRTARSAAPDLPTDDQLRALREAVAQLGSVELVAGWPLLAASLLNHLPQRRRGAEAQKTVRGFRSVAQRAGIFCDCRSGGYSYRGGLRRHDVPSRAAFNKNIRFVAPWRPPRVPLRLCASAVK